MISVVITIVSGATPLANRPAAVNCAAPANTSKDIARVCATFSPAARAVYDVLTNTDPERADDFYARLPAAQREGLHAVSPVAHVAGLRAPVFLMHDRGDPLIPYVESRRFRDALAQEGRPPYASEFDIFEHVDPTRGGSPLVLARDGLRLFMHIHAVLSRLE